MFKPDPVVGEIADPQGTLGVGSVADTECVCLYYESDQGDRRFSVVYTSRELSTLIASVKKGMELAPSTKPRSTIRLSTLPPKPIRLQVVLVVPENKSAVIILRFLGPDWKQDVVSPPDPLIELLRKAERRAPLPGVVGTLDRFGPSIWMIEGQTLEVSNELSHGTGFFGDYVHHSEVPEGQVVRAWPADVEQKNVVVVFEYGQTWEPSTSPDLPQGQKGDQALADGLVRESREIHAVLSKTMYDSGRMDPVWSGKVALSSMIGDVMMSDDKNGHATWSGKGGNPVLKQGVESLRAGNHLSPHDQAIFSMISAYYFTKAGQKKPEATTRLNKAMASAWNYARFNAPHMRRIVLNNWYLLLQESGEAEGSPAFADWEEARSHHNEPLHPVIFSLPSPYPWVKTWKPAKTSDEPEPTVEAAPAAAAPARTAPPPKLPPIKGDRPPIDRALPVKEEEELPAQDDAPPEDAKPLEGMDEPKKKSKKRSPVPLVVGVLFLLAIPAAYYAMVDKGPAVEPTPTPTVAATPTQTPTPIAVEQTPEVPVAAPLPAGPLLINGFTLDGKTRESDLIARGYKPVEVYTDADAGIGRYRSEDGEIIANLKMPARQVTAIQGDRLTIEGEKVADLETLPESFADDERFSRYKIQAVMDEEGKVRAYTLAGEGIYLPEPLLGAPPGALELSRKIKDEKFFESLPEEFVNMYLTDGNPLLFQYLGSFENDRLKYLLAQGADPNQKSWVTGGTSLHALDNVKTAKLLLELGADPTITNNEGLTPAETAATEELRQVLATVPAPTPTQTPAGTPSPGVTETPAATESPAPAETPASSPSP